MTKVLKLSAKQKPADAAPTTEPTEVAERPRFAGSLAADELKRPGGKLLAMLVARAEQLGMKLNVMCQQELGCTYGYLHQMRNGDRKTAHISDDFATRCALFLGVPRITVLMASGRVSVEDYFDRPKMAAMEIPKALRYVLDDPEYGVDLQMDAMELSLPSQFAIVRMYEKATGRKLLKDILTMESLVQQLSDLDGVIEKLKSESNKEAKTVSEDQAAGAVA